jgi:hypothetical protein
MSYRIPTSNVDPFYSQITDLDGTDYVLTFEWNNRDQAWYLSIADINGDPIVTSLRLVPEWRLLRRVIDERRPQGELFLHDESGAGLPPGFEDLGTRCTLFYVPAADL